MTNSMPPGLAEALAGTPEEEPSSDKLVVAQTLGKKFAELNAEIAEDEEKLKEKKAAATRIARVDLPDLLAELKLDHLGLADEDSDLRLKPWYKASISSEWDAERQERAFAWLEANGFGSLVKHEVTYSFRRGEENQAAWLVSLVSAATEKRIARITEVAQREGRDVTPEEAWDMPSPTVRKTVPHATLTSLVRHQTELPADDPAKKNLPLEVLGAAVGRIVEIKPRAKK